MFDMRPTVRRLSRDVISVLRANAGSISSTGRASAPTFTTTAGVRAAVQPIQPRDLKRLPEGTDVRDVRAVWTLMQLFVANPGAGTVADQVILPDGDTYQVEAVDDWDSNGLYFRSLVRRLNTP